MAATLANAGKNPVSRKQVMKPENVPEVLAVMAVAGLYDGSGKWLYRTGLPAKSGVGGGVIAVSPGKFGIAVVSPPLDEAGNSVRAQKAIADISNALAGNPYKPAVGKARDRSPAARPIVRQLRFALPAPRSRPVWLQHREKSADDDGVEQIDEECPDERHDDERDVRRAVTLSDAGHVRHRSRRPPSPNPMKPAQITAAS